MTLMRGPVSKILGLTLDIKVSAVRTGVSSHFYYVIWKNA